MSLNFSKKSLISFVLFFLAVNSKDKEPQVFKCSPQTLDALCSVENPLPVCALDDDNQYLTLKSACEACGYEDTVSYTEGPCTCPQAPCAQGEDCTEGKCINLNTSSTRDLVQLARTLLSKEKHAEAFPLIKKVIEQRPQDSYPLYLGALAAFGDKKNEESLKFVKKAITIDPKIPDFYVIRGRAFAQLKQHEQAEKQFQKALELGFKDYGLISFYQAQNLLMEKRTEEAIKKYQQAISYHPEKTSWYVRKALAHSINKEERMAVISCQQGLKIDPNNQQILQFMQQFKIMHQDKEQDLQDMQERNLKASNNSKEIDPEVINKFIAEKDQQAKMEFDRQRLQEKKKKQEEERKKQFQLENKQAKKQL